MSLALLDSIGLETNRVIGLQTPIILRPCIINVLLKLLTSCWARRSGLNTFLSTLQKRGVGGAGLLGALGV